VKGSNKKKSNRNRAEGDTDDNGKEHKVKGERKGKEDVNSPLKKANEALEKIA